MLLRKICLSFLDVQEKKECFHTSRSALSLRCRGRRKKETVGSLAAFLCSLQGDPQADEWGDDEVVLTRGPGVMDVAQKIQNGLKLHQ